MNLVEVANRLHSVAIVVPAVQVGIDLRIVDGARKIVARTDGEAQHCFVADGFEQGLEQVDRHQNDERPEQGRDAPAGQDGVIDQHLVDRTAKRQQVEQKAAQHHDRHTGTKALEKPRDQGPNSLP